MTYFLVTFAFMLIVVLIMAVGVIFGRRAIKGSCGGTGDCACEEKCEKRKQRDAEAETQKIEFNPNILKNSVD